MSLCASSRRKTAPSFPRVSGDEPVFMIVVVATLTFSPRERG